MEYWYLPCVYTVSETERDKTHYFWVRAAATDWETSGDISDFSKTMEISKPCDI